LPTALCQRRFANGATAAGNNGHEKEGLLAVGKTTTRPRGLLQVRGMAYGNLAVLDGAERVADAINRLIAQSPRRLLHVG
jgi:hypothetical protein